MVHGESRYFTLSCDDNEDLSGFVARLEVYRTGACSPVFTDELEIVDNKVEVRVQTQDLPCGSYSIRVFMTAPDGFVQAHTELIEVK